MNKEITIGLDIDGVLANNNGSLCAYLNTKYPNNRFTEPEIDNWDYVFTGIHEGKTIKLPVGKCIDEFWNETGMVEFLPMYQDVESGIDNLMRIFGEKLNFIFITSRPEKYKVQTVKWIESNITPIINKNVDVYFVRDKSKPPADVLIDDNLNNLKTFVKPRNDRVGILIERPWNNLTKKDIKESDGKILAAQSFQFIPTILKTRFL
jgi:5'(3')-deoxyribonucleotidase